MADETRPTGRPRRRRWFGAVLVLLVIALAAGAWYAWGPRPTPPGQPPLVTLQDLEPFRAAFDGAADQTRVLLLLSPT